MCTPIVIDCSEESNLQKSNLKIAVFVNLFYIEEYEWCMHFLSNIPQDIALYITTSNDELFAFLE